MIKSGFLSIALTTTALLLLESGIRIASAETITLTLSNGDKIQGTLVKSESTDTVTVIDHPSLGKLKIQSTALKAKPKKSDGQEAFQRGLQDQIRTETKISTAHLNSLLNTRMKSTYFLLKPIQNMAFPEVLERRKVLLTPTKDN